MQLQKVPPATTKEIRADRVSRTIKTIVVGVQYLLDFRDIGIRDREHVV